ncbi:CDP-alcohol phosphatidyltransferase family protein [Alicyclobacillus acidocaldarius]|uniref:CDP-alcohol phosphatidyltransferase n=1 Tax=Alicyclobacillus acidocaldarius (strain Tc-4-1) TaxID=1048834 RepID=F8IJD4_ALIAT|nr:CDP-alcohol phosphatidyltransferase family protein [Alicyclobacillus acidocaldarius]AEJ43454.1 CDP-alcohol phosphatidyltransferase [Alicyclobacillus acidocaldarius subsp. acidocaldarius Tc-4-1]
MSELQRIDACAKRPIDIWTNYLFYPLSIRLVYLLRNTPVTPNQITLFSLFLCLLGCVGFSTGIRGDVIAGLVLVEISYVFDCADGQLARYRQQFSAIGGWLDQVADRIKEFAIYFSLAYGYTRWHPSATALWAWAMTALFALYLLEYYGQIRFKPRETPSAGADTALGESRFRRAQRWRSLIPFRGFIIGEQYFALLVFVAFNAIAAFFHFVAVLGLVMCVYRPAVQLYKWSRGIA